MANRFPLIVDSDSQTIKELPSGDNLNLTGNSIILSATDDIVMGVETITDTKVSQWDSAYGWGDHASGGYAVLANDQTFTGAQRGTVIGDSDLSFDMNAGNNFLCTTSANGTLTFTNITAGQSGNIFLDNSTPYVISAAATTFIAAADLTTINTAGKYFLSYFSPDGTNVYVSSTPATTSAGA